ncbi:MAG: flavodoxin-dependent (E)-4-hydroxy-3-methylbut-2-enyl-diphosphate synthase [Endomicrobium sp.]|jgi:(E)-4-hydroxy-3-methylbut-2-enyl-diphosphate synthase|nr:flavodoxin-dependent (E)-4-hydroxy-3-methylbut-2-enyl-diphosphate synthase [Endomicrobium sp.]
MKFYKRYDTKKINIGGITIGGGSLVAVQSMTNTDSRDWRSTVRQIKQLEEIGCEIIRVSFPDLESVCNVRKIKKNIKIPLIADIHFDYRIAVEAIKNGIDKLRINPGNIGSKGNVEILVKKAKKYHIPIRIGINAGSLNGIYSIDNNLLRAKMLVNSAMKHIKVFEKNSFYDIVVSLKTSNIDTTIKAYKLFSSKRNYPLHLGITEAGPFIDGSIKSAVGLGIMLFDGIGDTIRISLTENPIKEVNASYSLLRSIGLRNFGVEIISCPTCSRCKVDLIKIVSEFKRKISTIDSLNKFSKSLKVAIMGCIVNGLGESENADFCVIATEKESGLLFKNRNIVMKANYDKLINRLVCILIDYVKCN